MKLKIEFINGSCPIYNTMLAEQQGWLLSETITDSESNVLYKIYERLETEDSSELEAYLIANNPQSGFVFERV